MHAKLERRRRLKHEHDSAPKTEPAHLLTWSQRLALQNRRRGRVHRLGVRPRRGWATADVRAQSLHVRKKTKENKEKKNCTHLIKVNFDTAHVRRAYGHHAEKPVPPTAKHRDTFVQHEQILRSLGDPRRYRKQLTCSQIFASAAAQLGPKEEALEP